MNEHNVKNHYRQNLRVTKATVNNLPEWRIYLNQELAARCASESFANEICSSLMGSFKHKMLSLVDSLIFPFNTEEEHHKARFSGYIPLCDVVRVAIKEENQTLDIPIISREEYINVLVNLCKTEDRELVEVYQNKWMYDIKDYE
jgi:hypothetical protein